ncbi:hypothetical protein SAMN06298226_0241 [Nitrosovibrio sp. Nv4]|nr:hypothetical protein SAMN06298226_0241 [Nitrosovibrio sp. Nv4]
MLPEYEKFRNSGWAPIFPADTARRLIIAFGEWKAVQSHETGTVAARMADTRPDSQVVIRKLQRYRSLFCIGLVGSQLAQFLETRFNTGQLVEITIAAF